MMSCIAGSAAAVRAARLSQDCVACPVKIVSIVGTRPQLIKAAALSPVLRARHQEIFIDTGQHYDESLAGTFFAELGLPEPDHSIGIGAGSHAEQTGAMLVALEPLVANARPDAVVVYGDTNSTLAGALVAAKLAIPVAHVEAGLRSFDRRMPEEVNRIVADHLSRWLFAPTLAAVDNLSAEGKVDGVELVGDLMQDLAARVAPEVRDPSALRAVPLQGLGLAHRGYIFATIHRAENRAPESIRSWAAMLRAVASRSRPVILALHPGTRIALDASGEGLGPDVRVIEPLGYRSSLTLQVHAAAVLTDSGGIQREAGWLGVPCLVLRSTTEWVELLEGSGGRMALVGLDVDLALRILDRWRSAGLIDEGELAPAEVAEVGAAMAISSRLAADERSG